MTSRTVILTAYSTWSMRTLYNEHSGSLDRGRKRLRSEAEIDNQEEY